MRTVGEDDDDNIDDDDDNKIYHVLSVNDTPGTVLSSWHRSSHCILSAPHR